MRLRQVAATTVAAVVVLLAAAPGQAAADPKPVDLGGTPVPGGTGSTDRAKPTKLTAGVWLDELGPDVARNTHYYEYARAAEGEQTSTVFVGAITTGLPGVSDSIQLDVSTPDGTSCNNESASRSTYASWPFGAGVSAGGSQPDDLTAACLMAPTLRISVTHSGTGETAVPVAIKIVEEARVRTLDRLPEGVRTAGTVPTPAVSGSAEELPGAASLPDAPELENGRYSTTLVEGEAQAWKVPLDWGQDLVVRARIPAEPPVDENDSVSGPDVELALVDPLGDTLSSEYDDIDSSGSVEEDEPTDLINATGPIRLRNRYDGGDGGPSLPGDYYVIVGAEVPDDLERDPREVEVTLDVEIRGQRAGVPTYFQEPPFLVGPDTQKDRKHVASGTGIPKAEQESLDAKRTQKIIAATALALVGLVATGGGLTLLRRRTP